MFPFMRYVKISIYNYGVLWALWLGVCFFGVVFFGEFNGAKPANISEPGSIGEENLPLNLNDDDKIDVNS